MRAFLLTAAVLAALCVAGAAGQKTPRWLFPMAPAIAFRPRYRANIFICDDTPNGYAPYCCPTGCSPQHGSCVRNFGCDCFFAWAAQPQDGSLITCTLNQVDQWQVYTGVPSMINSFIALFAIMWFITFWQSLIGLFSWIKSGGLKLVLLGHGAVVLLSTIHIIWLATDPFQWRRIFPTFWDVWFRTLGFPLSFAAFVTLVMFWSEKAHEDSVEGSGVSQIRSLSMPFGGGGAVITFCLLVILVAISTNPPVNSPSLLWRIFICVWVSFAWLFALLFIFSGLKAYSGLDDDQKGRFRGATFLGAFAAILTILLGLLEICGFYSGAFHNPLDFFALMFMEEFCFVVICWLSIYVMRPASIDRFFAKIFPCCEEQEEMFGSSTIARPSEADTRGRE